MASVTIMKNDKGKLEGFGQKGARTWNRFMAAVREMAVGELLSFTYKVPRSPKFHRLHFAMLRDVFEAQEQFADDYQFRKWAEVGAGHADFLPGPTGRMVALPRSIAYDELDDEQFSDVHSAVKSFLRSQHARRFLWPHLEDARGAEMVETILMGFDR